MLKCFIKERRRDGKILRPVFQEEKIRNERVCCSKDAYQRGERFCFMRSVVKPEQTRFNLLNFILVALCFVKRLVWTSFFAEATLPRNQIVSGNFDGCNCCRQYLTASDVGYLPGLKCKYVTRCAMDLVFVALLLFCIRMRSK